MGQPGLFFHFLVFSDKYCNFYDKYMWKNVHPIYSARIRTNDLRNTSLLPQPLDQGSRPIWNFLFQHLVTLHRGHFITFPIPTFFLLELNFPLCQTFIKSEKVPLNS